jgi:hypothetical protein
MRRLGVWWVALAIPVIGLLALPGGGTGPGVHGVAALLGRIVPGPALAQTSMTFRSVPAESATALESRGEGRKSHVRVSISSDEESAEAAEPDTFPSADEVVRSGDVTRMGEAIHVKENEIVRGDVVTVMGGDVTVDGTVHGDVVAALGGDIFLNSTARVEGDVVCIGGELHEEPGAYVSGKRVTGSGGDFGGMHRRFWGGGDWGRDSSRYGLWGGLRLIGAMVRFLLAIGLTLLVAWLFRRRVAMGAETMRRQAGLSCGIGALVLVLILPSAIALAVVSVLLAITLIGIPLAVVAILGYVLFFVIFAILGLTIGATVVGEWLASRQGVAARPVWQYALFGVLLVYGARFVGRVLEVVGVFGFHALGVLLVIASVSVAAVLGMIGGGAWLKWEFSEGMFGRWWGHWQGRNGRIVPGGPVAASAGAPAASAPPPPYAAGAPGEPPPPPPPPPDATPGT